jgi:hypothetical protein
MAVLFLILTAVNAGKGLEAPCLVLTDEAVVLRHPLLGQQHRVALDGIVRVEEERYAIRSTYRGIQSTFFEGRATVLHLANGQRMRFNSLEIPQYEPFVTRFQHTWQPVAATLPHARVPQADKYWTTSAWISFMLVCTGGLLLVLFKL